jgi:hypothetical protein
VAPHCMPIKWISVSKQLSLLDDVFEQRVST